MQENNTTIFKHLWKALELKNAYLKCRNNHWIGLAADWTLQKKKSMTLNRDYSNGQKEKMT